MFSLVNSAVNMALPAFAAERRAAARAAALLLPGAGAVNRYVLRVRRSAANRRTPLLRLTDGTD